eukprot:1130123_1
MSPITTFGSLICVVCMFHQNLLLKRGPAAFAPNHNLGPQVHANTSMIHTSSTYRDPGIPDLSSDTNHRDITATNPSHIRTIIESNDA